MSTDLAVVTDTADTDEPDLHPMRSLIRTVQEETGSVDPREIASADTGWTRSFAPSTAAGRCTSASPSA